MHISQAGFIGEVDQVLAVFQQNMEEAGRAALPLKDCNINVNVVCAEKGIVSSPFVFGSDIGGSVSNSINVTKPALRRRAKENSEPGSTTKRPRVEVCGYLQNVSQLISRSASEGDKYFTATLQRSSGNVQVLVFNQRLHQDFCDAQIKQKPVILNNVNFEELQQKVIFSQTSKLSYRDSLDFKYDFKSSEPKTVASVLEVKQYLAGELINITGTITDKQEDLKDVKGRQMMRRRHSLADHSDVITLTGWGDKCNINPGSCYTFSHVRVKKFGNQTELTLTPQTKLTEVPAPGDKVDVCSRKNSRTFKVLGASVQNWHKCVCGHELPLLDPGCTSVQCSVCKDRVSAQAVTYITEGRITLQTASGPKWFYIPKSCIKSLLGLEREGFCNVEEAENKLLQMEMVEVVFWNDEVVEMKEASQAAKDGCPD